MPSGPSGKRVYSVVSLSGDPTLDWTEIHSTYDWILTTPGTYGLRWPHFQDIVPGPTGIYLRNTATEGTSSAIRWTYSDNFGRTWTESPYAEIIHAHLRGIHYLPGSSYLWYVVCEDGLIFNSTESMPTVQTDWDAVSSPTVEHLNKVTSDLTGINGTVIVVGENGTILRSTSQGAFSLVGAAVTSEQLNRAICLDTVSKIWIIIGDNGTVLRSTDDGVTWASIDVSGIISTDLQAIATNGSGYIIAAAEEDPGSTGNVTHVRVISSGDYGLTWMFNTLIPMNNTFAVDSYTDIYTCCYLEYYNGEFVLLLADGTVYANKEWGTY